MTDKPKRPDDPDLNPSTGEPWTPSAAERFGGPVGVFIGTYDELLAQGRIKPPKPVRWDAAVRLSDFPPGPPKDDDKA